MLEANSFRHIHQAAPEPAAPEPAAVVKEAASVPAAVAEVG